MEPPRPRGVPWGPQLVSELQKTWQPFRNVE